ncbi:MAG: flagellar hook-length control protein FliK [Arcobacteraceae bacterium]
MTKEAGFLETIVKDTKNINISVGTSNKDEVKTVPSLFDSMLSNVNSSTSTQESEVTNEKVASFETTKTANNNSSNVLSVSPLKNTDTKVTDSEITQTKNSSSVVSLLDKLVQEASLQIQDENTQTIAQSDAVQAVTTTPTAASEAKSTETLLPQTAQETVPKKESSSNEIPQKILTNTEKLTNEANSASLLDRLLQEANVQIQNDTASGILETANDEILVPKEITQPNVIKPLVGQEGVIVTPVDGAEIQNGETKVQNSETSASLLDKLVKEVNVQIQNESVKTVNANEVEVVTTTQIKEVETKEVVKVQEQKVVVEIKELKNQETLQNTLDGTKNSKETVTLVQTKTETTPVLNSANDKVAQELAKVTETLNEKTSLTKEQLDNVKPQAQTSGANNEKEAHKSLLDKLLDETKATIKATQETAEIKTSSPAVTATKMATEPILTNIYLSSLNKASQDAFLEKNQEVKTLVANASSVKDVQKGADLLNLGLQSSEVIVQEEEFKQNVKNEFLSKLSINRDIIKHDITKMSEEIVAQSKTLKNEATAASTTNLLASKNLPEVEVNVSAANAYTIENRIIGARQQMGSMMSDLARNMYLNYKPPVTAFRMNLNPGNLGSIAVLIKNDKESGLSISLNMSNVATLDSIVDNQGALRAALAKNFNTNANINLEFNMQDGKQEGSGNQQNKKQQQNHQATNDILESLSNQNESNKVTNYM